MSRADKLARRRAEREAFLQARPLHCTQCGAVVTDQQLVDLARQHGYGALCDDCSFNLDTSNWTIEQVFS
jgi:hypothetical protein